MHRSLRRVVWLTREQRATVLACANEALNNEDAFPWHAGIERLIVEISGVESLRLKKSADITLTITGLHLPKDALPITVSDEEVDVLVVWGDLPDSLARLLRPDATVFPVIPHRCSDNEGGLPCHPPKKR